MEEYLTPSGKMMNEYDLGNLTMEQVFNMLIKLDVADKALLRDFKKLTRRTVIRPRTTYYAPKIIYRTPYAESPTKIIYTAPLPSAPITPGLLTGTRFRLRKAPSSRSPRKSPPKIPVFIRTPGTVACPVYVSKSGCENDPLCYWTGRSCITK